MGADQISADVSWFVALYSGASGRAWLEQLPAVIGSAAAGWDLDIEHPLSGGLLSCVLAARRRNGGPAVLTIAGPWAPARREALALEHWDGGPSPRLPDFDDRLPALLLERIWPGDMAAGESCDRVARLISTLHAAPPASAQVAVLPSLAEAVEQRFVTAPAEASARSEAQLAALAPRIQLARQAAGELLRSFAGPHVLLHGDLRAPVRRPADEHDGRSRIPHGATPSRVTVTGAPFEGSADLISTLACSIPAMPRASMAHIAYALAPPVIRTVCGVAVAENG